MSRAVRAVDFDGFARSRNKILKLLRDHGSEERAWLASYFHSPKE